MTPGILAGCLSLALSVAVWTQDPAAVQDSAPGKGSAPQTGSAARASSSEPVIEIRTHMPSALEVNGMAMFTVEVEVPEGWASKGRPSPVLQIDCPPSVELTGRLLTSHKELASNGFLMAPYARELSDRTNSVSFKLISAAKPEQKFGLNILLNLVGPNDEQRFIRRRIELPLVAGAHGTEVKREVSKWGPAEYRGYQIGDRVDPVDLPHADGSTLSLAELIGKQPVVLTTYRAHW